MSVTIREFRSSNAAIRNLVPSCVKEMQEEALLSGERPDIVTTTLDAVDLCTALLRSPAQVFVASTSNSFGERVVGYAGGATLKKWRQFGGDFALTGISPEVYWIEALVVRDSQRFSCYHIELEARQALIEQLLRSAEQSGSAPMMMLAPRYDGTIADLRGAGFVEYNIPATYRGKKRKLLVYDPTERDRRRKAPDPADIFVVGVTSPPPHPGGGYFDTHGNYRQPRGDNPCGIH